MKGDSDGVEPGGSGAGRGAGGVEGDVRTGRADEAMGGRGCAAPEVASDGSAQASRSSGMDWSKSRSGPESPESGPEAGV